MTSAFSKYTSYQDLEIGGTNFGESIQPAYKKRFNLTKHSPASNIRDVVGDRVWNSMFKFSIVRNPYDRVISTYNFLNGWSGTPEKFKEQLSKFSNIDEYISSDIWDESSGPDNIFKPQTFWLTDNKDRGKVIVDFVGRLETLDSDLNKVISKIENVEDAKFESAPVLNRSKGESSLSDASIEKVNEFYKRDFKFWGYEKIC